MRQHSAGKKRTGERKAQPGRAATSGAKGLSDGWLNDEKDLGALCRLLPPAPFWPIHDLVSY
jgi:hypothetical protein